MGGLGLSDGLRRGGAELRHLRAAAGCLHGSGATGRGGDFRGSSSFGGTCGGRGIPRREREDLGQLLHLAGGHGHVPPFRAAGNDVDVRRLGGGPPVASPRLEHGEGGGGVGAGLDAGGGGYLRVNVRRVNVDLVFRGFGLHTSSPAAEVHFHEVVGELDNALSRGSVGASDSGVAAHVVPSSCSLGAGGLGGPQSDFSVVVH